MQTIDQFLWFEENAEDAVKFYTSVFDNSKAQTTGRYDEASAKAAGRKKGSVLIIEFSLYGQKFIALNGGPVKDFTFNPSVSFFVNCGSEEEIDTISGNLSEGGEILMPLDKYSFSEKYVWLTDKFGVSWQLNLKNHEQKIAPFLWFKSQAEEAMNYYTAVFSKISGHSLKGNDSHITMLQRFGINENGPVGKVQHARFTLNGQEFIAMDSNPDNFTPAISLFVNCETQQEVDYLWEQLSAGGQTSQCGWLTDKFGITWQIIPTTLMKLRNDPDPVKSQRVIKAMLNMTKIEIAGLEQAYNG